ncbi:hypothetical protein Trydic_g7381 [Trypoxylus dichotomus]
MHAGVGARICCRKPLIEEIYSLNKFVSVFQASTRAFEYSYREEPIKTFPDCLAVLRAYRTARTSFRLTLDCKNRLNVVNSYNEVTLAYLIITAKLNADQWAEQQLLQV